MFLAIRTDKNEIETKVFEEFNKRLQTADFPKNPYVNSKIHLLEDNTHLLELHPIYANFGWYIFIIGLAPLMFGWVIPTLIISGLGLLFALLSSPYFVYFIIKINLKKKQYKGLVKYINKEEVIEILLNGRKQI